MFEDIKYLNLHLFDNTNVSTDDGGTSNRTGTNDLSAEMKTFYSDYLIDNAKPKLVHDQFGQKRPIPRGRGKEIEFRRFSPFPKALTPLVEGVTPSGRKYTVTTVTARVRQYGDYVEISDILALTSIDNNIAEVTELLGNQAGETLDTVTREVINGGMNVQYAGGVAARYALAQSNKMTIDEAAKAARSLKNNKAQKISGYYPAIIHPDVVYDVMRSDEWIDASEYAGSSQIFEGEIGKTHGLRYVETTESKIFHAYDLTAGSRTLSIKTSLEVAAPILAVKEAITDADAAALAGRKVLLGSAQYTILGATAGAAGAASITVDAQVPTADGVSNSVIYPGEAGAAGTDVYSVLVLGQNAYGVTELEGGGLEHIFKPLGSGGTSDPLNQRATIGWKATKTAEILVDSFIRRVEVGCTFQSGAN